ncbi:hypothetical protein IWW56_000351 [Coemansia sp. RSA 2131]|nr:hypothetical protein IWW56_000351 [Coemansia sp. RSA 2131]
MVDSATFDAQTQHENHEQFILFDRDFFTVYIQDSEPFKCHYQIRNQMMDQLLPGRSPRDLQYQLEENNGVWESKVPPIHFFVSQDTDSMESDWLFRNTIFEYIENPDLAALSNTVQNKPYCQQKYFIVNQGANYTLVDVANVDVTLEYTADRKHIVQNTLRDGSKTVQMLVDEETRIAAFRPNPTRKPGFKLRDASGREILDGEPFMLQILTGREDEDVFIPDFLTEDEKRFYGKDWINTYFEPSLGGGMDSGSKFYAETIDGIVYLKEDTGYLHAMGVIDDGCVSIDPELPRKENRVQIHYTDDGDVLLSAWGGRTYVVCEWVKAACGIITLDLSECRVCENYQMKLRIVRVE